MGNLDAASKVHFVDVELVTERGHFRTCLLMSVVSRCLSVIVMPNDKSGMC